MKSLIQLIILLSFGLIGSTAYSDPIPTLDFGDDYYVGAIIPNTPSSPSKEANFINRLIHVEAGEWEKCGRVNNNTDNICDRAGSDLVAAFPDATAAGAVRTNTNDGTGINVAGFDYILGKYGQDALVWYIGDHSSMTLNIISKWTPLAGCEDGQRGGDCPKGGGLSHWTLFNFNGGMEVPEPGTLGLLGLGLLALSLGRRRRV